MSKTILEVIDLKKHFSHPKGRFSFGGEQRSIPAVDGASFYIKERLLLEYRHRVVR